MALPVSLVHDRQLLFSGAPTGNVNVWDVRQGTLVDHINHDGESTLSMQNNKHQRKYRRQTSGDRCKAVDLIYFSTLLRPL